MKYACCLILLVLIGSSVGCAEGPLWRLGQFSPWAREKWEAEEQIADTLFERKRQMNEAVERVKNLPAGQQDEVARRLHEIVLRDQVLLLRLHAVRLLADLDSQIAVQALRDAAVDPNPEVRIAAVRSWTRMPSDQAIAQLQEIIGSDTNVDVRLAATRALGEFSGAQAVRALAMSLKDPDPAIQVRAMDSMARCTGESFGRDVRAWAEYARQFSDSSVRTVAHDAEDPTR